MKDLSLFLVQLLHNNYDRNLTTDNIYNLSHELKKKTLKNQQLGRILSQIRSRPASWTEDQAQMCTDRGSEKSDLEKNRPSKKSRALTIDLGTTSRMATYRSVLTSYNGVYMLCTSAQT